MSRNGNVCGADETIEQYIARIQPEANTDKWAGFVYILGNEYGYYKIGESINPERRFTELQKKYQFQWYVVCVLPSKSCWRIEQELIAQYKSKRIKGWKDWFALTPDDIEAIKVAVK